MSLCQMKYWTHIFVTAVQPASLYYFVVVYIICLPAKMRHLSGNKAKFVNRTQSTLEEDEITRCEINFTTSSPVTYFSEERRVLLWNMYEL